VFLTKGAFQSEQLQDRRINENLSVSGLLFFVSIGHFSFLLFFFFVARRNCVHDLQPCAAGSVCINIFLFFFYYYFFFFTEV
jgi:hypothetical protein